MEGKSLEPGRLADGVLASKGSRFGGGERAALATGGSDG